MHLKLIGDRVALRALTMDDLEACCRLERELVPADAPVNDAALTERKRRWLEWTVLGYEQSSALCQPPYGERAIVELSSGEVVGLLGLVPMLAPFAQLPPFGAEAKPAKFSADVGLYWALRPLYRGRGFATNAAQLLVRFAFDSLNLARILASTEYNNTASIAVMVRLGMRIDRNPLTTPEWFQVTGSLTRT